MRILGLLPLFLLACADEPIETVVTPPVPGQQSGTCPAIDGDDTYTLESNGRERDVIVYTPDDMNPGKPVLFLWYGVGDSGTILARVLEARRIAQDHDVIVVVPQAVDENPLEWGFLNGGEDDLALYDDMRSCLYQDFDIDLSRIYSTGFSGGGLWTTFLTMHRSDTLASVLMFSGGTEPIIEYENLDWDIPVLLSWGGPSDVWGVPGLFEVEFEATTLDLQAELAEDGHTVISCNHDLGHTLPSAASDMVTSWLFAHQYRQPSPFAEGALEALPDFCERIDP